MTFKLGDRVRETSTTTGTGALSLAGASVGFQSFASVLANGDTCWFAVAMGPHWEVGIGTFATGSPPTLARSEVLASSNGGAAVNFPAGDKDVFITSPASALALLAPGGNLAEFAALTSAADKLAYFTGPGTAALADFTSVARTLLAQSTADAQAAAVKQGWVTVSKVLVASPATVIDITLGDYSRFRITFDIIANAAAADGSINWAVSRDNSATWENGASDYSSFVADLAATYGVGTITQAYGILSNTVDTARPDIVTKIRAEFHKGGPVAWPSMQSLATGNGNAGLGATIWHGVRGATGAVTNLRFAATQVDLIGANSLLHVEGQL